MIKSDCFGVTVLMLVYLIEVNIRVPLWCNLLMRPSSAFCTGDDPGMVVSTGQIAHTRGLFIRGGNPPVPEGP